MWPWGSTSLFHFCAHGILSSLTQSLYPISHQRNNGTSWGRSSSAYAPISDREALLQSDPDANPLLWNDIEEGLISDEDNVLVQSSTTAGPPKGPSL